MVRRWGWSLIPGGVREENPPLLLTEASVPQPIAWNPTLSGMLLGSTQPGQRVCWCVESR